MRHQSDRRNRHAWSWSGGVVNPPVGSDAPMHGMNQAGIKGFKSKPATEHVASEARATVSEGRHGNSNRPSEARAAIAPAVPLRKIGARRRFFMARGKLAVGRRQLPFVIDPASLEQ